MSLYDLNIYYCTCTMNVHCSFIVGSFFCEFCLSFVSNYQWMLHMTLQVIKKCFLSTDLSAMENDCLSQTTNIHAFKKKFKCTYMTKRNSIVLSLLFHRGVSVNMYYLLLYSIACRTYSPSSLYYILYLG